MARHEVWAELARLKDTTRFYDAVIEEQDPAEPRRIRIGDDWMSDFASCNYLGFDVDPEITAAPAQLIAKWGTHPSWSRLLGSPRPYLEIEEQLADLLQAPDTLVLPTITHIHMTVIPVLAGKGTVFCEAQAHRTIYDGSSVARGNGATLHRWRTGDLGALAVALRKAPKDLPRLVCMDGINSMTGNEPGLAAIADICRAEGALLYVDDAHGFGVIGERSEAETSPFGASGNSIVRHLGESYEGLVLVGGFSKAYSSLLAFLALPTQMKEYLKFAAAPYLYSGPSPTASLATVLAGFKVNRERGEEIRGRLWHKTARVIDHVRKLGLYTPNMSGFPIIELPAREPSDIDEIAAILWERGIYVTLAAYPLVPRDQAGFRIQVTAANTDEEVERLNATISELAPMLRKAAGHTGARGPWPSGG